MKQLLLENWAYISIVIKLALATILGGVIGYEREIMNRPAGFRTHILVCIGSALVMCTSEFILEVYSGILNVDPARLGAQVISGIGFLGAGTIIRDGINVRGLTTAASLWAVSCVGIAIGIGFYSGAIIATFFVYITLIALKNIEHYLAKKTQYKEILIEAENIPSQIGTIGCMLSKKNIKIRNIEFIDNDNDNDKVNILLIKLLVKVPPSITESEIILDLYSVDGVRNVHHESHV